MSDEVLAREEQNGSRESRKLQQDIWHDMLSMVTSGNRGAILGKPKYFEKKIR